MVLGNMFSYIEVDFLPGISDLSKQVVSWQRSLKTGFTVFLTGWGGGGVGGIQSVSTSHIIVLAQFAEYQEENVPLILINKRLPCSAH